MDARAVGRRPLNIWMVTPEIHRVRKTGGMADVVYGLSEGLLNRGHRVTVVMPEHLGTIKFFLREGFKLHHFKKLDVPLGEEVVPTDVFGASIRRPQGRPMRFYFIDAVDSSRFGRHRVYGYEDDPYRFFFLNRATYQLYAKLQAAERPDIVHGHDWQSGYLPHFLKSLGGQCAPPPSIYSIHNLGYGYQNRLEMSEFARFMAYTDETQARLMGWGGPLEFHGKVDGHKTGIVSSDRIVTVSPRYREEILAGATPAPANLYAGILQNRQADLCGILNGLPDDFRPAHFFKAKFLLAAFSSSDLSGKTICRQELQGKLGLPVEAQSMIVVWSSRLAGQKGIDIVLASFERLAVELPKTQFVFVADGENGFQAELQELARRFPRQVRVNPFSERLEILALAGGDVYLMPSRYEPCGLGQMKAQLFGCLPVVHETGGLIDTVQDGQTGFSFKYLTPDNMIGKLKDAWAAFQQREAWKEMVCRAIDLDYSWHNQSARYEELYYDTLRAR